MCSGFMREIGIRRNLLATTEVIHYIIGSEDKTSQSQVIQLFGGRYDEN